MRAIRDGAKEDAFLGYADPFRSDISKKKRILPQGGQREKASASFRPCLLRPQQKGPESPACFANSLHPSDSVSPTPTPPTTVKPVLRKGRSTEKSR